MENYQHITIGAIDKSCEMIYSIGVRIVYMYMNGLYHGQREVPMPAKGYSTIAGLEKLTASEIKQRNRETYGESVKKYRIKAGYTADQLAELLDVTVSAIRNWESGYTRPDPEYLYRMFTILNVEPNEFFGIGGIGTLMTTDERSLLDHFRQLDESGKEDLLTFAEVLSNKAYDRKRKAVYQKIESVPFMSRAVAAGDGVDWEDHPDEEKVLLYCTPDVEKADEIFIVNGDSMEPQYQSGDHVLVEYCNADELKYGDIGIFYAAGYGGVIKQKAHDRLHSLNPSFDDIVPYEDGAQVIGRVIGKVTKDMLPTTEEKQLYEEAVEMLHLQK